MCLVCAFKCGLFDVSRYADNKSATHTTRTLLIPDADTKSSSAYKLVLNMSLILDGICMSTFCSLLCQDGMMVKIASAHASHIRFTHQLQGKQCTVCDQACPDGCTHICNTQAEACVLKGYGDLCIVGVVDFKTASN